jgi:predicted DNA-binding transcriptional regulator AlpA
MYEPEKSIPQGTEGEPERLVTADEFADRLAVGRRTLGQRLSEGALPPPIRIRGRLYWREAVVADFIRSMQQQQQ